MRYEIHQDAVLPPRALTFVGIAALHVCFVYLFMSGLAQSAFREAFDSDFFVVDDPPRADDRKPDVVPTDWEPPRAEVPFPDVTINDPVPDAGGAITAVFTADPTPSSGTAEVTPPPPEPIRLIGTNRVPNAERYYPAGKKRDGIEGATVVRACVDERGRLQGDPVVVRSSGYNDFDRGAIEAARDGRYARATQGGQPIPNCYAFKISFVINPR
jgi:TonB family protein